MTENVLMLGVALFVAGFGIGYLNMACGDRLGMKRVYRFCGLMK